LTPNPPEAYVHLHHGLCNIVLRDLSTEARHFPSQRPAKLRKQSTKAPMLSYKSSTALSRWWNKLSIYATKSKTSIWRVLSIKETSW
jgi:hypothetical protein